MPRRDPQLSLTLPSWGGARRSAGRKPSRPEPSAPHDAREHFTRSTPVHVSLRVHDHVWNLRSERSFSIIHAALERVRRRPHFAVVHFAVQGNHIHLLVEAEGPTALANGMRALCIRIARGMNHLMARRGPVFRDRYHAHVLRTPAEVRNALRYVLGNHASHARRRGEPLADGFVDRYSSEVVRCARVGQLALWAERATEAPESWLLRTAARDPAKPMTISADSSHAA
jgi:REP element-mobilizing transposase RayT